jgi:hypothetical protein
MGVDQLLEQFESHQATTLPCVPDKTGISDDNPFNILQSPENVGIDT